MNYYLKVIYMNNLFFSFKSISDKVRQLDKNHRKLKRYTFKMICIFTTDKIMIQKLVANGCFDNVL